MINIWLLVPFCSPISTSPFTYYNVPYLSGRRRRPSKSPCCFADFWRKSSFTVWCHRGKGNPQVAASKSAELISQDGSSTPHVYEMHTDLIAAAFLPVAVVASCLACNDTCHTNVRVKADYIKTFVIVYFSGFVSCLFKKKKKHEIFHVRQEGITLTS